MKKTKVAFFVLVLALVLAIPAAAMARPMDEVQQRTENGTVFVPLRLTAYAHGADVEWDGENHVVIITSAHGDVWAVYVEGVGGFIEHGTSWVPYEYAVGVFDTTAVEEATAQIAEETGRPQIHGMLTRIEYGDNVAYIFGSMHAGRPDWFPLHPMVEDAMRRADVFGFELDMDEMMDMTPEMIEELIDLMLLPDELTLEDILPEDVFDNFMVNFETFSAMGLDYSMVARLTPIALVIEIEMLMLDFIGLDIGIGDQMVDGYIAAFARSQGAPIIGFEEIMGQARLIFDVPLELQVYALIDFPNFDTVLAAIAGDDGIAEAYERQDIDAIRAMLYAALPMDGNPLQQHDRYITWDYRDRIYANGIAELLRETEEPTTFFVTFGLSHIMGGNAGIVLYLLEDMGFEVVPLWK